MRVLHVYKDVYPPVVGGIERHIDSLRQALPHVRQDVLVCSRERRTLVRPGTNGTEYLVGELGRALSTPLAPAFPRWLRRTAPGAIVHLHVPNPTGELSALVRPASSPLVVSYHADIHRQRHLLPLYRPLLLHCLRTAGGVLTSSRTLLETSPVLRRAAVPVDLVPYGLDVERFAPDAVDRERAAALRERHGGPHVLAVGRLVGYKGFDRLVRAAPQLPWPVVIVGDGPEAGRLRALVRDLRLDGRVHLVGRVDDDELAAHLAAAEAFVLPSLNRAEAYGIVLLEAQAAGLPVVATDVATGTAEAIEPGVTGLLVAPDDERALAEAVNTLAADPERRRELGEAGRRRVAENNSLRRLGERVEAVYRRVLAR